MAVKTFTDNTSLPASDINTYLNNGGLVYITQATATNAPSLTVNNAFSATYDAYRIVLTDYQGSIDAALRMVVGTTATGYYWSSLTVNNAGTINGAAGNNDARWELNVVAAGATTGSGCTIDIQNPFLAKTTIVQCSGSDNRVGGAFIRLASGFLNNTTSYTSFAVANNGGNISCKAVVYGYRMA